MRLSVLFSLLLPVLFWGEAIPSPAGEQGAEESVFSLAPLLYHRTDAPTTGTDFGIPWSETHALWPLGYGEEGPAGKVRALHPLFYYGAGKQAPNRRFDLLWPLLSWKQHTAGPSKEERLQVLPAWFSEKVEGPREYLRVWRVLFPIYYQAKKHDLGPGSTLRSLLILFPVWWQFNEHRLFFPFYWHDTADSFALWPLYGDFKNLFHYDRIQFALWPLYKKTQRDGVLSYSAPWPFLAWMQGPEKQGARLWPLAGYTPPGNTREGRWFWLWPLGHAMTFATGPLKGLELNMFLPFWFLADHNKRKIAYYFPFYGYSKSPQRTSRAWLWPLYARTDSIQPPFTKHSVLWFFLSHRVGPGERRAFYLLNLLGWHHVPGKYARSHFFWPVAMYKFDHLGKEDAGFDFIRHYLLPFWYAQDKKWETGLHEYRRTLWPLCAWGKGEEERFFRLLQLIPTAPGGGIERNWAPLWTLLSMRWDPERDYREHRLLGPCFGLRQDARRDVTEWNFLFLRYAREGKKRTFSLLGGLLPITLSKGPDDGNE